MNPPLASNKQELMCSHFMMEPLRIYCTSQHTFIYQLFDSRGIIQPKQCLQAAMLFKGMMQFMEMRGWSRKWKTNVCYGIHKLHFKWNLINRVHIYRHFRHFNQTNLIYFFWRYIEKEHKRCSKSRDELNYFVLFPSSFHFLSCCNSSCGSQRRQHFNFDCFRRFNMDGYASSHLSEI